MYEIRNGNEVWYKDEEMINWILYGRTPAISALSDNKFEVKVFDIEKETFVLAKNLAEIEVDGIKQKLQEGCFELGEIELSINMEETTYFAVFETEDNLFKIYFPDISGVEASGVTLDETVNNAKKALGFALWQLEKEGRPIPNQTLPPFAGIELNKSAFTMPISVIMDIAKSEIEKKSVEETVIVPDWLSQAAKQKGISLSQVMQTALKDALDFE